MSSQIHLTRVRSTVPIATTVVLILAVAALLAKVGADAQWLAALGHVIATRHSIPTGVPFAVAPTGNWPNVLVLAELAFNGLERAFGDRGLMLAQLAAVGGSMMILARDARAGGAAPRGTCAALLIAALGALPSLAIARVQMFSLVLFPLVVMLLRAEVRRPSRRIWLVVPLLALWSNLHGAALLGVAVLFVYLLLVRLRQEPLTTAGLALAAPLALCLTPALGGTIRYYHGLLTNVAAQRGEGMWGPLSLHSPLDVVLLAVALALGILLTRARPRLWEWAVAAALAAATVQASRNGVWLLLFLAPPAARALSDMSAASAASDMSSARAPSDMSSASAVSDMSSASAVSDMSSARAVSATQSGRAATNPTRTWQGLAPIAAVASLAVIALTLVRGPTATGAGKQLVAQAITLAHGSPVLAAGGIDEQVALRGGRIWVGNPIDAFSKPDQAAYLDFIQGNAAGRQALDAQVRVVLVSVGSPAQTLMSDTPMFAIVGKDRTAALYERTSGAVLAGIP